MPHTLFISDLHLCAKQQDCAQGFLRFLQRTAPKAEELYILGDLFEYWAGDDDLVAPFHQQITHQLLTLSQSGTRLFIMRGNRDLLMGKKLEKACGAKLLPDLALINLYEKPTLLCHGDALCTDDVAYQTWRAEVHQSSWQQLFLAQPLIQRKTQIEQLRKKSKSEKQQKTMSAMDVNGDAVTTLLRNYAYPRLIHGHTHRAGHILHHIDGHSCERWVLGDWDNKANALRCDRNGCIWEAIPD